LNYTWRLVGLIFPTFWIILTLVGPKPQKITLRERSVQLLDAMRASCEIAAQAEQHLIIAKRPRRYEGHFASTGTRNSKVRALLFLRIRRGNLLTFGICWTILGDFWDSRRLLVDFWDYTWRLFGLKETFSRCWDYNSHPFVNGFVGSSSQAWDYTWRLFRLKETFSRFWDYTLHPFVNGFVGSSSQADYLMRNAAMDDSIGGS
jgi:hypothetical protein